MGCKSGSVRTISRRRKPGREIPVILEEVVFLVFPIPSVLFEVVDSNVMGGTLGKNVFYVFFFCLQGSGLQ